MITQCGNLLNANAQYFNRNVFCNRIEYTLLYQLLQWQFEFSRKEQSLSNSCVKTRGCKKRESFLPSVIPSCSEKQVSDNFLSIIDASSPDPRSFIFFGEQNIQTDFYHLCNMNKKLLLYFCYIALLLWQFFSASLYKNIPNEVAVSNKGQLMVWDLSATPIIFRAALLHIDSIIQIHYP